MHKSIYQPGNDWPDPAPKKSPASEPLIQAERGNIDKSHPDEWAAYRKLHEATFTDPLIFEDKNDAAKDRRIESEAAYRELIAIRGRAAAEASCRAVGWMDPFSGREVLAAQAYCQRNHPANATPLEMALDAVEFHSERSESIIASWQSIIDEHLRWADIFSAAASALEKSK